MMCHCAGDTQEAHAQRELWTRQGKWQEVVPKVEPECAGMVAAVAIRTGDHQVLHALLRQDRLRQELVNFEIPWNLLSMKLPMPLKEYASKQMDGALVELLQAAERVPPVTRKSPTSTHPSLKRLQNPMAKALSD